MSTPELSVRENLIKYTIWVGSDGSTDQENQGKVYEKYGTVLGTSPL
jgi:hypothetical protein